MEYSLLVVVGDVKQHEDRKYGMVFEGAPI